MHNVDFLWELRLEKWASEPPWLSKHASREVGVETKAKKPPFLVKAGTLSAALEVSLKIRRTGTFERLAFLQSLTVIACRHGLVEIIRGKINFRSLTLWDLILRQISRQEYLSSSYITIVEPRKYARCVKEVN